MAPSATGAARSSTAAPGRRLLRSLAAAPAGARASVAHLRTIWRRSLRLRVVTTTLVLSLAVVALLGTFLVRRIADGLLDAKVSAALVEAATGAQEAQAAFDSSEGIDTELLTGVVERLATGSGPAGLNEVLLVRSTEGIAPPEAVDVSSCPPTRPCTVPARLREAVRTTGGQQWTYTVLPAADGPAQVPAIAIGTLALIPGGGIYELYYLFPLEDQVDSLNLIQRTLGVAGLALVLLVGLIAYVVTRQVVTPVRMAARISERLAAGRLEERMGVRGEDDLARLATSFNKMATNLQRQIRQLEDLSRVQRRFVSDVSHELRTPLTTVRMAADVLHEARGDFEPATARSAELLQAQLDRFESLLTDLLEISRFDAGAAALELEPADLRILAQRVIDAFSSLADARGTLVRLQAPPRPCVAEVDSRRIDRILRNLLANAVEHGGGNPIEVYVDVDERAVAVAVRDHGVGLRPGDAALVFNRFWRADPARARTTGGTGLGLAIALEDAHLHGGWLQAWGQPGDGALFRLTVPRRPGVELNGSPLALEPRDASLRPSGPYRRSPATAATTSPAGPDAADPPAGAGTPAAPRSPAAPSAPSPL